MFDLPVVDAAWLEEHIAHVVVADVRWYLDGRSGREAYDNGHLPGAVFLDLDTDLSDTADATIDPDAGGDGGGRHPLPSSEAFAASMRRAGISNDTPVVAYDDAGGAIAARLWWMLDRLDHPVAILNGGIDQWTGELETSVVPRLPGNFTAEPWPPTAMIDADTALGYALAPDAVLIDARSHDRYAGTANLVDRRFGHIPGAVNSPFSENLDATGLLHPDTALVQHYRELDVFEADGVAVYCGSGVTACLNILALELAGAPSPALYVGSWSDYEQDPTRAVATTASAEE